MGVENLARGSTPPTNLHPFVNLHPGCHVNHRQYLSAHRAARLQQFKKGLENGFEKT